MNQDDIILFQKWTSKFLLNNFSIFGFSKFQLHDIITLWVVLESGDCFYMNRLTLELHKWLFDRGLTKDTLDKDFYLKAFKDGDKRSKLGKQRMFIFIFTFIILIQKEIDETDIKILKKLALDYILCSFKDDGREYEKEAVPFFLTGSGST